MSSDFTYYKEFVLNKLRNISSNTGSFRGNVIVRGELDAKTIDVDDMTAKNMSVESISFETLNADFINLAQSVMPTEIEWAGTDELKLLLQDDKNASMWIRADANNVDETQGPSIFLTQDGTNTGSMIRINSDNNLAFYDASSAGNNDGRFQWYTAQLSGADSTTLPTFSSDVLLMDLNDVRLQVNTTIEYSAAEDATGSDVITVDNSDHLNYTNSGDLINNFREHEYDVDFTPTSTTSAILGDKVAITVGTNEARLYKISFSTTIEVANSVYSVRLYDKTNAETLAYELNNTVAGGEPVYFGGSIVVSNNAATEYALQFSSPGNTAVVTLDKSSIIAERLQ